MEALEDEPHMPGAHRGAAVFIQRRELGAVEPDATFARLIEPRQQRQQRRFARAGAPTIATVSPAAMCRSTSARMVSVPSGLLTCLVIFCALRTGSAMLMSRSCWHAPRADWLANSWTNVLTLGLANVALALLGLAPPLFVHAQSAPERPVILVVGDSLSAGYGVAVDATWVALLQRRLAEQGYGYRVVNASISGETTGGARCTAAARAAVARAGASSSSSSAATTACAACR